MRVARRVLVWLGTAGNLYQLPVVMRPVPIKTGHAEVLYSAYHEEGPAGDMTLAIRDIHDNSMFGWKIRVADSAMPNQRMLNFEQLITVEAWLFIIVIFCAIHLNDLLFICLLYAHSLRTFNLMFSVALLLRGGTHFYLLQTAVPLIVRDRLVV